MTLVSHTASVNLIFLIHTRAGWILSMDCKLWLSDGYLETSWALVKKTAPWASIADLLNQNILGRARDSGFLTGSPAFGKCAGWKLQVCMVSMDLFSYKILRHISASWDRRGSVGTTWLCPPDSRCGARPAAAHTEQHVASVETSEARDSAGAPGDAE